MDEIREPRKFTKEGAYDPTIITVLDDVIAHRAAPPKLLCPDDETWDVPIEKNSAGLSMRSGFAREGRIPRSWE
jgi:hypothetical protein